MTAGSLIERIADFMPAALPGQVTVVVAVSGGADSVALLRLAVSSYQKRGLSPSQHLVVAHFNHQTRGEESEQDQQFVRKLAEQLQIPFSSGLRQPTDLQFESSINPLERLSASEQLLRQLRYNFLTQVANQAGARLILTGHNADDQAETILFRTLRGTGLAGIRGIRPTRMIHANLSVARPLLTTTRQEIENFLNEIKQPFREDSSNHQSRYTRNYIRNKLLPQLESQFGWNIKQSLIQLGIQAAETDDWIDGQAEQLTDSILVCVPGRIELAFKRLSTAPILLIRQFLKQQWQRQNWPLQSMSFQWWQTIAREVIANANSGAAPGPFPDACPAPSSPNTMNLPGGIRAYFTSDSLVLEQVSKVGDLNHSSSVEPTP